MRTFPDRRRGRPTKSDKRERALSLAAEIDEQSGEAKFTLQQIAIFVGASHSSVRNWIAQAQGESTEE